MFSENTREIFIKFVSTLNEIDDANTRTYVDVLVSCIVHPRTTALVIKFYRLNAIWLLKSIGSSILTWIPILRNAPLCISWFELILLCCIEISFQMQVHSRIKYSRSLRERISRMPKPSYSYPEFVTATYIYILLLKQPKLEIYRQHFRETHLRDTVQFRWRSINENFHYVISENQWSMNVSAVKVITRWILFMLKYTSWPHSQNKSKCAEFPSVLDLRLIDTRL